MARTTDHLLPEHRAALARVVVVANAKGGVAKTSTATHVAGLAAAAGWNVLLVDLDPQGSCGQALVPGWPGNPQAPEQTGGVVSDHGKAMADTVIMGAPLRAAIEQVRPNLDFIPGGSMLKQVDDTLIGGASRGEDSHGRLATALLPLMNNYDLVIIDTPPSSHHLLQLALRAARWLVIPTKSDRFSIQGLNLITEEFISARAANPTLALLGVALVATGSSAHAVRRNAIADIQDVFGGAAPVFEASTRLAEASSNEIPRRGMLAHELAEEADEGEPYYVALQQGRKPVRRVGSVGGLAEDYSLLVQEILQRIAAAEQAEGVAYDEQMAEANA